jgi:hypothetical protein
MGHCPSLRSLRHYAPQSRRAQRSAPAGRFRGDCGGRRGRSKQPITPRWSAAIRVGQGHHFARTAIAKRPVRPETLWARGLPWAPKPCLPRLPRLSRAKPRGAQSRGAQSRGRRMQSARSPTLATYSVCDTNASRTTARSKDRAPGRTSRWLAQPLWRSGRASFRQGRFDVVTRAGHAWRTTCRESGHED